VHEPHQSSQEQPAEPKELSAEDRVLNFFEHMFGGQHDEINRVVALEKERGREPGQHLQVIYNNLCEELGKHRIRPRYRLSHVFSSPGSPFPNMRLAYEACGAFVAEEAKDGDVVGNSTSISDSVWDL
jgi:hypothetical protein